jgi:hypothetical protein
VEPGGQLINSRFLKTATTLTSADRYTGNSNLTLRPELAKEDPRQYKTSSFSTPIST